MEKEEKKIRIANYKEKKSIGGVQMIRNTKNGKALLLPTPNAEGAENRFAFALATGGCIHPKLQADWGKGGPFTCVILDTLEKEEDWDNRRFREELEVLCALWMEKFPEQTWY